MLGHCVVWYGLQLALHDYITDTACLAWTVDLSQAHNSLPDVWSNTGVKMKNNCYSNMHQIKDQFLQDKHDDAKSDH